MYLLEVAFQCCMHPEEKTRGWQQLPSQHQGQFLRGHSPFWFRHGWRVSCRHAGRFLYSAHQWRGPFQRSGSHGSFLTPSHISFSMLKWSPTSTTGARHSQSSCTTPWTHLERLWYGWHTSGAQKPVLPSPLFIPPDNPGLSLGLSRQGILSFLAVIGRMGQSRHHVLPSRWPAGGRPQLAGKPNCWLGHHHNAHPQSWQEDKIPPTTLGACYPSPKKLGPNDSGYWGQCQSLLMTSFLSRKGDCGAQQQ